MESEERCVFCDLLDTGDARWVAREERAVAFLARDALAPGHTLVVPRRHSVGVLDVPADDLAAVTELARRVARGQQEALGCTGVNVLNASGPHSGQSVDHLHLHVVPRWPEDAPGDWLWPEARSSRPFHGDEHVRLAAELSRTETSYPS